MWFYPEKLLEMAGDFCLLVGLLSGDPPRGRIFTSVVVLFLRGMKSCGDFKSQKGNVLVC